MHTYIHIHTHTHAHMYTEMGSCYTAIASLKHSGLEAVILLSYLPKCRDVRPHSCTQLKCPLGRKNHSVILFCMAEDQIQ